MFRVPVGCTVTVAPVYTDRSLQLPVLPLRTTGENGVPAGIIALLARGGGTPPNQLLPTVQSM